MSLRHWEPGELARWRASSGVTGWGLRVASRLYELGVTGRNIAFDRRLLRPRVASMPVISVGNIVTGGTGKTSIVRHLATILRPARVGIVTRGYGHSLPSTPHLVRLDEPAWLVGDEPALLSRWLPDVPIMVSGDRWKGAHRLNGVVDVVLLDDGFQHRWLDRELDIVVIAPSSPDRLLPRGDLREPLSGLKRADLLWIHEDGLTSLSDEEGWWKNWTLAPVIRSRYVVKCVNALSPDEPEVHPGRWLEGRRVHVLTAIARGERVDALLKTQGAHVTGATRLADHHPFGSSTIAQVTGRVRQEGAGLVVTTEKDAVKLLSWDRAQLAVPIFIVKVQLEVFHGCGVLRHHLESIIPNCRGLTDVNTKR